MKGSSQVDTNIYPLGGVSTLYPNLTCEWNCAFPRYFLHHTRGLDPAVHPHSDSYPNTLQVTKTPKQKEVEVRLGNVGCLTAEYPHMSICKWYVMMYSQALTFVGRPECLPLPRNISNAGYGVYCRYEVSLLFMKQ